MSDLDSLPSAKSLDPSVPWAKYLAVVEVPEDQHTGRTPPSGNFLDCDAGYLNLESHPEVLRAKQESEGIHADIENHPEGTRPAVDYCAELERQIADFCGTEASLVYSCEYVAMLSALSALLSPKVLVLCDELIERDLLDGVNLAGAELLRFSHNDLVSLRGYLEVAARDRPIMILVNGVCGQMGDIAPLPDLVPLAQEHGASLFLLESHAFCVLGAKGSGTCEHFDLQASSVDVMVGSMANALPTSGAFVAGSQPICTVLRSNVSSTLPSATLPQIQAAAALKALKVFRQSPSRLSRLRTLRDKFCDALQERRIPFVRTHSMIVPICCDGDWEACRVSAICRREGYAIHALGGNRGRGRIRIRVNGTFAVKRSRRFADTIAAAFAEAGTPR